MPKKRDVTRNVRIKIINMVDDCRGILLEGKTLDAISVEESLSTRLTRIRQEMLDVEIYDIFVLKLGGKWDDKTFTFLLAIMDKDIGDTKEYDVRFITDNRNLTKVQRNYKTMQKLLNDSAIPLRFDTEVENKVADAFKDEAVRKLMLTYVMCDTDRYEFTENAAGDKMVETKWQYLSSLTQRVLRILYDHSLKNDDPMDRPDIIHEYNVRAAASSGDNQIDEIDSLHLTEHPNIEELGNGKYRYYPTQAPTPKKNKINIEEEVKKYVLSKKGMVSLDEIRSDFLKRGYNYSENSFISYLGKICHTVKDHKGLYIHKDKSYVDLYCPPYEINERAKPIKTGEAINWVVSHLAKLGGSDNLTNLRISFEKENNVAQQESSFKCKLLKGVKYGILSEKGRTYTLVNTPDEDFDWSILDREPRKGSEWKGIFEEAAIELLRNSAEHQMNISDIISELVDKIPEGQKNNAYSILNKCNSLTKTADGKAYVLKEKDQ